MALLLVSGGVGAQTLSFDAALQLAEQQSPDLMAQTAAVEGARSLSRSAGTLPDPKLAVGLDNVPVAGMDAWSLDRDFMTMQKIGLMQEWPNNRKRQAQAEAAVAHTASAEMERRIHLLALRRDTALAWLERYYLERRSALLDELERENRLFDVSVQAQLTAGRGQPADVVSPRQEAAELADRRDELAAELAKSRANLRRFVGAAGDDPPADDAPVFAIDAEKLRAHVHEHAEIQAFAPQLDFAQAEIREAEAMKRPDWEFELSYGRRGAAFDDMVSMQVTIGLPLFSGTRIDPQIAAKHQALRRVEAERVAMLREHTRVLEAELADYAALTRQIARLRDTRLALAQQKVDLRSASYRANKVDLSAVLEARRELIEQRLQFNELEARRAALAAKLYFAYGEGAQ